MTRMHHGQRARAFRGVTLIELLVTMAVLAILSSMAVTSYQRYALRAYRSDATTTLLRIQVAQEKYFLQNGAYINDNATMAQGPPNGLGIGTTTPNGRYTINVAARTTAGTTYAATATATGAQTKDAATCLTFTIDDQGLRTPNDASGCWH
jgi:type IV pilus assembly protein PilE